MDAKSDEKLRPSEFIAHYAELVRQREEALGHPVEDGPTFRDMIFLYQAFEWLDKQGNAAPPQEVHALMELISDVRDAWTDPESDPIGAELFPVLSEIHFNLGKEMDKSVPEAADLRRRQENLRALQRAIRRQIAHPAPGILTRFRTFLKRTVKK